MYRYGRDVYRDHLILYKRYDEDPLSATFSKKRDTLGELWLRYENHPLAIPAITPINRKYPSGKTIPEYDVVPLENNAQTVQYAYTLTSMHTNDGFFVIPL